MTRKPALVGFQPGPPTQKSTNHTHRGPHAQGLPHKPQLDSICAQTQRMSNRFDWSTRVVQVSNRWCKSPWCTHRVVRRVGDGARV